MVKGCSGWGKLVDRKARVCLLSISFQQVYAPHAISDDVTRGLRCATNAFSHFIIVQVLAVIREIVGDEAGGLFTFAYNRK